MAQMASGKILPILKEDLVAVHPLTTSLFVADTTYKFISRHYVLCAQNVSVNLKYHVLQMGTEGIPLSAPRHNLNHPQITKVDVVKTKK